MESAEILCTGMSGKVPRYLVGDFNYDGVEVRRVRSIRRLDEE